MRTRASLTVTVALVAGLVAACAGAAGSAGSPGAAASAGSAGSAAPSLERVAFPDRLAGTVWKAVEVVGAAPQAGREPSIDFQEAQISGSGGCNAFTAGYEYDAGTITVGESSGTLMACDGPVGTLEGRFFAALTGATAVSIDPDGRLILDGPGGRLVFEVGPHDVPAN
jgi:heat shock protein HslJ